MATIEEALAFAVTRHRAGQVGEAVDIYRRILEVDARHLHTITLLAQGERHLGNFEAAIDLCRRAFAIDPGHAELHSILATTLRSMGRFEEAVASLRRAIALNPGGGAHHQALGSLLLSQGGSNHLPEAVILIARVTVIEPTNAGAAQDLGVALRHSERLDEAIASQWRAIALKPDLAVAWMAQANFINERGDRELGLACIRRATALSPEVPENYYNHGNIQHTRGEGEAAYAMYRRAFQLGLGRALVRAASVLIDLGRFEEAEADLRRAPTIPDGETGTAISLLTRLFARTNRLSEGAQYFADLGGTPAADGISYRGECLTALATLYLEAGQAHEAKRLLARVVGDSSHLFTVKSIAAFRVTLDALGATLPVPPPTPEGRSRVSSSTLATHGRFAHNALEYIMVRLYAEKYGYALETPEWVGGYYFDIDHPRPQRPLRPLYFPRRIINRLIVDPAGMAPLPDCDILSPLFLMEHKEEYRERVQSWLKPRPVWRPFLDPVMTALRGRGDTVVAIHIRRGDFITCKYPLTQTAWYVDWLRGLWGELRNPVLYLASDDLEGVRRDFQAFSPVTRADLAEAWEGLEFLQDFHVLAEADVVGISAASGFSVLAARLNTTARLFVEPDMQGQRIRAFRPWVS